MEKSNVELFHSAIMYHDVLECETSLQISQPFRVVCCFLSDNLSVLTYFWNTIFTSWLSCNTGMLSLKTSYKWFKSWNLKAAAVTAQIIQQHQK